MILAWAFKSVIWAYTDVRLMHLTMNEHCMECEKQSEIKIHLS